MAVWKRIRLVFSASVIFLCMVSCGTRGNVSPETFVFMPEQPGNSLEHRFAPAFQVSGCEKEFNRIGTPEARLKDGGRAVVSVNPEHATMYVRSETFETEKDAYTNLYYRVHFRETPFSFFPFHLTAGKNPGLYVIVTLDSRKDPVLLTTVHTCGCYLAMIPTDKMPSDRLPEGYLTTPKWVYGETLPGILPLGDPERSGFLLSIKGDTHRVNDVSVAGMAGEKSRAKVVPLALKNHESLRNLPVNGGTSSFYHEEGICKGYVKGAIKPWESLFMSLIAMDFWVGTDKVMEDPERPFYTSLKPWNRRKSDMNDFPGMLEFWGWRL